MVGLSKEEFLASNARALYVNPQDRDQVSERLVKEGRLRDIEIQMKKADGTPFWILLSFEPMGSEEDGHYFSWVYDISERKRAELELEKSRDTFQALADNLPEFISMKDLEGRFLFVNKRFEEWVCVDRNDVIGKTADDIYPKEQAIEFNAIDRQAIESRKVLSHEVELDYPDGSTRGIIRLRFPVFSSDGEMLGLGTVNHDITERKQQEEALRKSEEEFRSVFETSAAGMALLDMQGRYFKVNRRFCEIIGYNERELLEMTWRDITHKDDIAGVEDLDRQVADGGEDDFMMERRLIHKNGTPIWTSLSSSQLRDEDGNPQ